MPIDRRASLGSVAAADTEIISLSAEIVRRAAEVKTVQQTEIDPYHDRYLDIICDLSLSAPIRSKKARAYSEETGHALAIEYSTEFDAVTDKLFRRLMAIPARTQAGRAAKVRALLIHVMRDDWRGSAHDLDWDKEKARALLGEFAGLSAAELEAV